MGKWKELAEVHNQQLTTEPKREWQGLTEEEVERIANLASSKLSAIYIVEAELKGKNYDKS